MLNLSTSQHCQVHCRTRGKKQKHSHSYEKKWPVLRSRVGENICPAAGGVEYFKMNMSFENTTGQKGMQTRHILESPPHV